MKPEKWQQVRELIDTARERRAANVLAVATKAGALIADAIETQRSEGADTRRPLRLRLLVEIETDLGTGEASGAAEIVPTSPS